MTTETKKAQAGKKITGLARALAMNSLREWSGVWDRSDESVERLLDEIVRLALASIEDPKNPEGGGR